MNIINQNYYLNKKSNELIILYNSLLEKYGLQGWWPINSKYYPGDYSRPKNKLEKFEICIGAILTQNTSWKNVLLALKNLRDKGLLDPYNLNIATEKRISELIKPAGYYNQKSKKLKEFTWFFLSLGDDIPTRKELLEIWGIGPETADSILLYAFHQPEFVVDTYTKRLLVNESLIKGTESYDEIKNIFHDKIPQDYKTYNEYHALIVEWGKNNK
ncbi:MAG: endonuclease III domain-containing protein [Candidatus Woesearchaeota archaeon]